MATGNVRMLTRVAVGLLCCECVAFVAAASEDPGLRTNIPFAAGAREMRIDTPSVFVPQTYQAGIAAGWHYVFSPDGHAVFSRSQRLDVDRVHVTCNALARSCQLQADSGEAVLLTQQTGERLPEGDAADGMAIARVYAAWVLGGQTFDPPDPPQPHLC